MSRFNTLTSAYLSGELSMKSDVDEQLGSALRAARVEASLSQPEVAELVDKSQSWVSQVESGYTALKVQDLFALAKAYGVKASVLLGQAEK